MATTKKPVAKVAGKKAPVKKAAAPKAVKAAAKKAPAKKAANATKAKPAKVAPKKAVANTTKTKATKAPVKKAVVAKAPKASVKAAPKKAVVAKKAQSVKPTKTSTLKKNTVTKKASATPAKKDAKATKAVVEKGTKVAPKKVVKEEKNIKATKKPVAAAPAVEKKEKPVAAKKEKKVTAGSKKAPEKKVLTGAAAKAILDSKQGLQQPKPAPTPAVSRSSRDDKKQVVVAHRKLENKSKEHEKEVISSSFKADYTRSILDQPEEEFKGPVFRYSDEDLQEFRELINARLESARSELTYLQGLITRKDEAGTDDTENRYTSVEDGSGAMEREQLAQLAGRQIQFINHLEKALIRIENKTYGVCRVTGKLIDKARLRAVPHATLSMEAKTKQ